MALERFSNLAQTTLNGAINSSVTSLVVTSASAFPTAGNFRILIDSEILLVTGVSGTTFTVTRGVEGTTAASHGNGATVTHVLTAAGLLASPGPLTTAGDLPFLDSSPATARLAVGSVGQVLSVASGLPAWVDRPDLLSALFNSEVAVTGATTATIGKMHKISGTSADYTITLPAASGNAGKFVGFRVLAAVSASKLYTLDGNSSETIDGTLTRVLWAEESAILLCDGSNWFKVAGKSVPMTAVAQRIASDQTGIAANTWTQVVMDAVTGGTSLMWDSANGRLKARRPGTYQAVSFAYPNGPTTFAYHALGLNSNPAPNGYSQSGSISNTAPGAFVTAFSCAVNDYVTTNVYSNTNNYTVLGPAAPPTTLLIEVPTW